MIAPIITTEIIIKTHGIPPASLFLSSISFSREEYSSLASENFETASS
jgi:hypothetical protein